MFTPGQLIRHQRERRGWTQAQLGRCAGVDPSYISRYESDAHHPTWPILCRILQAMGMQPRVVAEDCDIGQHRQSVLDRRDLDEWPLNPDGFGADQRLREAAAALRPSRSENYPTMRDLLPLCSWLEEVPFVLTGRMALRMHGLGCTVPWIDVVIGNQSTTDLPSLWELLSRRMRTDTVRIWSPHTLSYVVRPTPQRIAGIAELTGNTPTFRLTETATEVRTRVVQDGLPPCVIRVSGDTRTGVPLLALSEFDVSRDPAFAAAVQDLMRHASG